MEKPDLRAALSIMAVVTVWGASFLLISIALEGFPPTFVMFARIALAALTLTTIAFASGIGLPHGREWLYCTLLGIVNLAAPYFLIAWAQIRVDSGVAAIYIATVPLATLLFARVLKGTNIPPMRWMGFGIGLLGVATLIGPDALSGLTATGTFWSQLALVMAASCYGFASVFLTMTPKMAPVKASAGAMLTSTAIAAPFAFKDLELAQTGLSMGGAPLYALICLGVVQTGLAQFLRFHTINKVGPVMFSVVGYLIPVWAAVLGYLVLGERLETRELAGLVIILGGVALSQVAAARSRAG